MSHISYKTKFMQPEQMQIVCRMDIVKCTRI